MCKNHRNKFAATYRDGPLTKGSDVILRLLSAGARAVLVALLIAMPALFLPRVSADLGQIIALIALLGALLTFVEYSSVYPSVVDFRSAPPFNRLRFGAFFLAVGAMTLICRGTIYPTAATQSVSALGHFAGGLLDVPFSPVRLLTLVLSDDAPTATLTLLRYCAGVSLMIGLLCLCLFAILVRLINWPLSRGAFNFWVNLPMFEPTTGGDVIARLKREAGINIVLGSLLPFLVPAMLKVISQYFVPITFAEHHPLIWMVAAWALIPASMIMRGIALLRIADIVEAKRKRAYAAAQNQEDGLQVA